LKITKVSIKNYQSLREVSVEIGAITAIVGPSDRGKSSFVRALRAWANNQAGTSFITYGKDNAGVVVEFEDGTRVAWVKGKRNEYRMGEHIFDKVGRSVPEEVVKFTGIREISFDKDLRKQLNFHNQFEPPFLVTDTPGTVAKIIGKLTNLNVINIATRECNRDTRRMRGQAKDLAEMISEEAIRLEGFTWLDVASETHAEAKAEFELVSEKDALVREVSSLRDALLVSQEDESSELKKLEFLQDLPKIEKAFEAVREKSELLEEVSSILAQLKSIKGSLESEKEAVEKIGEILTQIETVDFAHIETSIGTLVEVRSLVQAYGVANIDLEESTKNRDSYVKALSGFEKEVEEFVKENPMCPLCEKELSEEHAKHLVGVG